MPVFRHRLLILLVTIVVFAATSTGAIARKKYDTGATDTEIKIGNIMPSISGSSVAQLGVCAEAVTGITATKKKKTFAAQGMETSFFARNRRTS
jgi:hypothetical protein